MPASRMLTQVAIFFASAVYAVTSQGTDVFSIVSSGENEPESLVRVVTANPLGNGKVTVTAVQGPCRREAKAKTNFVIQTTQPITKDDLFFKVPDAVGHDKFSLRRATSDEVAMYEKCHWR